MKVFGRGGTALLPMLNGGAAGLRQMREEARRLGIQVSTEDARAADDLGDAWDRIKAVFRAAVFAIGGALAPSVSSLTGYVTELLAGTVRWIRENKELIATAAKIAVGVTAVGLAIVGLGLTVTVVGVALSGLASAVGLLGQGDAGERTARNTERMVDLTKRLIAEVQFGGFKFV
jgi:hypothetical protein